MGVKINFKLTKNYILSKVDQITIFSTYFNLPIEIINDCINKGTLIKSPLRYDEHPTCGFKYNNKGKLKFRDFGGYFWGDCFDAVAFVISNMENYKNLDINKKDDFIKVLRHITFTFKDIFYGNEVDPLIQESIKETISKIKKQKPIIELVVREWNDIDIKYWKQFNVDLQTLNINFIYPIDQFYINRKINPEPKYYYSEKDICYGYFLGRDRDNINSIKIYFPNRDKSNTRFITNCNHLEGIYQLDKNDYDIIIITKSTKDRVSIYSTLKKIHSLYGELNINNIGVINIPHETYRLKYNEYNWLISKLSNNGIIVSLMDNDRTGKLEAQYLRKEYNILPMIIPKEYKAKDFSELFLFNNKRVVYKLIIDTIKQLKEYEINEYNEHPF
ncbi:hypothetical protein [Clostridium sp.]|uniref:hypothetical protein n=1 Tax=Clostridium sp. TaxID=1506 RepID=UPI0025C3B574|nr:hypothetical protein [Clostridium sp.]